MRIQSTHATRTRATGVSPCAYQAQAWHKTPHVRETALTSQFQLLRSTRFSDARHIHTPAPSATAPWLRDSVLIPADSSSLLNANHSHVWLSLIRRWKSSTSTLSNAVPTSIWELRSGKWSAFNNELESTGYYDPLLVRRGG